MGQIGDLSPQGSIALGILVGLVSTSVQSLGLTLQRKSHILEDEKESNDLRRPPFRRRRWQSGLVFNSICATLILGEPFTRWSLGGTILVCAGAVLIAIFGAIAEPAHNLDQLLMLLSRRQFIIWMIVQAILVLAIITSSKALKYLNPRTSHIPRMRLLKGMAYGGVSGILSAHSLLVAKSAVELLVRTIVDRHNEFNRWQSWMILLGLLGLALSQLYYLHRGLKLCSTSILYPFVFCVYNIIAILDGLIYFDQSSRLSVLHALLIALGTAILLTGVLALSWRLDNDPTPRTPVAQTPLAPGLRFVDDQDSSDADTTSSTPEIDEEAALLGKESSYSTDRPCTPMSKNDAILKIRPLYRKGATESEEIWEELQDELFYSLPYPSSPLQHRRSSARSTSGPPPNRNSRVLFEPRDETTPTESTSLLARSGTGRNYRAHRRRRSAPGPKVRARETSRRSAGSQEALGGWWKMKWWKTEKVGKGKGKEADDPGGGLGPGGRERRFSA
ncbi:MAG: hypothetical protein Q9217_000227 [Psora testacea]